MTAQPRVFTDRHKQVDWGLMIDRIIKAGWSYADIEKATGVEYHDLSLIANGRREPPVRWIQAFKLLDLFLMSTHNDKLPFLGETHFDE